MLRYLYAFTPLVIVGTVAILALPWLGLIALILVAPVALLALAALAWAVIAAPYFLIRSTLAAGRAAPPPIKAVQP